MTTQAVSSQIKENRVVSLDQLVPHPQNYRQHPESQVKKLVASLQRFGQGRSIVVQDGPEHLLIVAGHGIVEAARQIGYTELRADILPASWTHEQVVGYLVADNLHSQEAEDDEELLASLLEEQKNAGFDLLSLGTDEESLRQMLESLGDDYLAGDTPDEESGTDTPTKHASLAERFIIPPFSVLDARQGYWQARKRAWIALGIQSELGRGDLLTWTSEQVTEPGLNYYRNQNKAAPGGSLRPAMSLGPDGRSQRGDGYGRPISKMGGTPAAVGSGGLADQLANRGKKGLARSNGQDLMRGEHIVGQNSHQGKAASLPPSPGGELLIDRYRREAGERSGERRLTWVAGDRPEEELDEVSRKILAAQPQSGTSIFDPVLCELAYRWFSPPGGVILDPFAGGSVRGIVAAKLGRQYVGIDLRQEQVEANEAQARAICTSGSKVMLEVSDPSQDYTPDLTPVMEHGGYLVKRDDLFQIAGVRGGKVRTVWALAQGAKGLVTSGSRHSPHVHRVAAVAQRLGIPCRIHIATGENTPDVQGAEDAGAEIIRHTAGYLNVLNARAREDAEESGYTLIPFGVVCDEAVRQIKHQTLNLPQEMKRLVVAVGSGVSLSGILHGLKEQGRDVPILGVSVGKDPVEVLDQYAPKDWRKTVTLVKSPLKFEEHPKETYLGDIPLDPTYEAKCLPYLQEGDVLWSIGVRASVAQQTLPSQQIVQPRWIVGDSRHISTLCPDVQADLVFTCPPYYDLEVYSDHPDDLSTIGTYAAFLQDYRAILHQAIAQLKENRFVCVVVGDIRDKKGFYRNFVSDTITACQDAGARLYNEAILVTSVGSLPIRVGKQFSSGRKLGKTHQNVLCFVKGDPIKAVKDCGPVVVEVPEEEDENPDEESEEVTASEE